MGPLTPLFWTSGDVSSGFQSQSGFCLIHIWWRRRSNITHSLRFTSGATPADLLAASRSLPHTWEGIGESRTEYLLLHARMLNRLSYAGSAHRHMIPQYSATHLQRQTGLQSRLQLRRLAVKGVNK